MKEPKYMHSILIAVLLMIGTNYTIAIAQPLDCQKCDQGVLAHTESKLLSLSREEVARFLCTFHDSCLNNIEYSEYSNELLFKVLDKSASDFIWVVANTKVCKEFIFDRLSNPLLDVDINALKLKVQNTPNANKHVKKKILSALARATEKAGQND